MSELINWGSTALSEYGIMTVISGLFIYLFYQQYKSTLKITATLMKTNNDIMKKLLDLQQLQKENINTDIKETESEAKEIHNTNLNLRMKISNNINQKLIELVYAMNLQRAAIFEFHNTNENLSGFPFAKYSCNFEIVKKGVIPIGNACNGLQFSMISWIISQFDSNGIYNAYDLHGIEENSPMLYHLLEKNNINHICFIGMYDIHNSLYGFVALEYDDEHEITECDQPTILSYSSLFSSVLDLKNSKFDVE